MNVSTSQEEINNCDKTHYTNWIYKHVTDGKNYLPSLGLNEYNLFWSMMERSFI